MMLIKLNYFVFPPPLVEVGHFIKCLICENDLELKHKTEER